MENVTEEAFPQRFPYKSSEALKNSNRNKISFFNARALNVNGYFAIFDMRFSFLALF